MVRAIDSIKSADLIEMSIKNSAINIVGKNKKSSMLKQQ